MMGLGLLVSLGFVALLSLVQTNAALAATSPSLGMASTFGVLSSTYTNTVAGTTINGDLGYITGPAVTPTVNGTIHNADLTYSQAGTSQGSALAALSSQACTHTFPAGAVDLATDTSHGTIGIYTPGVYCTTATSAASIGTAGITLSGSGTYIFRVNGALTTVANSAVRFSDGASACNANVWWTPSGATTLGANSTFIGTDIDASGITVGTNVTWTGRALAFGGTVTSDASTITVPTCLTLTKTVINNDGGAKAVSDFPLFVGATPVTSGVANIFIPGVYTASETTDSGYTASIWGGDCTSAGNVTLANGDNKTCTITNNDVGSTPAATLTLIKTVINNNGGIKVVSDFPLFIGTTSVASGAVTILAPGTYTVSETTDPGYTASIWGGDCSSDGSIILANGDNKTCTITNNDVSSTTAATLTLIKSVTNDNGGSALATAWTLSANGPTNISGTTGSAAVTNAAVSAGSYTLSESGGPSGYTASTYSCVKNSGDPVVSNAITLVAGDIAICTITNNDVAPAVSVPTLNEWGIILFMMLAGLGSVYYLRKYRRV